MSNTTTESTGVSFFGLLTILFIGLKLGSVINWSWIWVLAPLWMPIAAVLALLVISVLIAAVKS